MRPYGCAEEHAAPLGPLAPDLTRSTTFAASNAEEFRAVGAGEVDGEFYPRYGHPAGRRFESAMARLEGADGAVSFASGMAALHGVLCGLLRRGDAVAAARELYGGTTGLLELDLPRFGIDVRRFDARDLDETRSVLSRGVRMVLVETPTNPLCRIVDLELVSNLAREFSCLSCVDATFAPPPLQHPIEYGFDLVMHSASKFLGGHSDCLGGVVSGRHELLEKIERFRRSTGGVMSADTAWMLFRSLRTLELRVRQASETAGRLARFLDEGGRAKCVYYPGIESHPDHELASRQMDGFGSVLAFEVAGGLDGARRVFDRFDVIARAVSLGGTETVALLPLYSSHAHVSPEDRSHAGIRDGTIRLSVGLEPYEQLESDLTAALD